MGAAKIPEVVVATAAAVLLASCGGGGSSATSNIQSAPDIVRLHGASCAVASQDVLFPMTGGFSVSPTNPDLVVYAIPDAAGKFQIHTRRLASGVDTCLTCRDIPGGPAANLHKGAPTFLADGASFTFQVESPSNPFPGTLGPPGAGWFNNVWIASTDGSEFHPLTDFPMSTTVTAGVLQPQVSPDGLRISFAQLIDDDPVAQADYSAGRVVLNSNPFGVWRLTIGQFTSNSIAGRIGASVSQRPAPAGATSGQFFEVSAWSADSRKILYTSDVGKDFLHKLDLWSYDVVTGELVNLTNSDDFDEFGDFSPDSRRIIYMSSAGLGWEAASPSSIPFRDSLRTELYLMDANGSNKVKVTDLNGNGMPASLRSFGAARGIVSKMKWSSDGRSVYYELAFFAASSGSTPGRLLGSTLMRLNFAGTCGRQ